jgi:hypothetical protein
VYGSYLTLQAVIAEAIDLRDKHVHMLVPDRDLVLKRLAATRLFSLANLGSLVSTTSPSGKVESLSSQRVGQIVADVPRHNGRVGSGGAFNPNTLEVMALVARENERESPDKVKLSMWIRELKDNGNSFGTIAKFTGMNTGKIYFYYHRETTHEGPDDSGREVDTPGS